ncbi:MAG: sugar ABC transporter permease [Clostridiales bacterium]|nr:sugar ABC transporter permease [Clostridiales bacterium]
MTGRKKLKNTLSDLAFVLPSLTGVCIFVLVPYADVIRRSFLNVAGTKFVFLKNYLTVIQNDAFRLAFFNTLKFMGICIPILLAFSLLIAVFLNAGIRGANYLKSAFLVPMAIPVASVVLIWRLLFHENGYFSGLLHLFGFAGADWMNTGFSFWILVFTYVWKNLGYNIVLWMAGLTAIPGTLYEAARVDGANRRQCFFRITLPNLKSTFFIVTVLSLLNSFKVFREAYLVGGDYPNDSMYLLQHLFNNWYRELALDKMSAASVMVAGMILVLILVLQRYWERE